MKNEKAALRFYDELNDAIAYSLKDWLRVELSMTSQEKVLMLNGAAAFLFDHLFVKENAGAEITKHAASLTGVAFQNERLSAPAYEISKKMRGGLSLDESTTPFAKYYQYIVETEEYVHCYCEDDAGRLVMSYLDELVAIVAADKKEISYLKIGETLFLNVVESWRLAFLDLYGAKFEAFKSYPFFEGVGEGFESIRSQILD